MHVIWMHARGAPGHVYEDVPMEVYRAFAKASSPGAAVNQMLNGFSYRPISPEELNAPSRSGPRVPR